jgi:hypothetical protein
MQRFSAGNAGRYGHAKFNRKQEVGLDELKVLV